MIETDSIIKGMLASDILIIGRSNDVRSCYVGPNRGGRFAGWIIRGSGISCWGGGAHRI